MSDLSISKAFLEKWMAAAASQAEEAAASPLTRPLERDTADGDGDIRARLGALSERSHQTESKIDRLSGSIVLLQQGMTTLLVSLAQADSAGTQAETRLARLDTDAQDRDKRLTRLEAWRYGVRLSWAALTAAAGAAAAAVTIGIEWVRH